MISWNFVTSSSVNSDAVLIRSISACTPIAFNGYGRLVPQVGNFFGSKIDTISDFKPLGYRAPDLTFTDATVALALS